MLGNRNVTGLPIGEIFSGGDLDDLVKLLKRAVREGQTIRTPPIQATVMGLADRDSRMVHTAVPISDDIGSSINRLFIYSEKA